MLTRDPQVWSIAGLLVVVMAFGDWLMSDASEVSEARSNIESVVAVPEQRLAAELKTAREEELVKWQALSPRRKAEQQQLEEAKRQQELETNRPLKPTEVTAQKDEVKIRNLAVKLVGVFESPTDRFAMVIARNLEGSNERITLKEGSELQGAVVKSIGKDRILFEFDNTELVLQLFKLDAQSDGTPKS